MAYRTKRKRAINKTHITCGFSLALMSFVFSTNALADNDRCYYLQPDLEVVIKNTPFSSDDVFTLDMAFEKYTGAQKDIMVWFYEYQSKTLDGDTYTFYRNYDKYHWDGDGTGNDYTGLPYIDDMDGLEEMQNEEYDRRSYWDKMYLINTSGEEIDLFHVFFIPNYICGTTYRSPQILHDEYCMNMETTAMVDRSQCIDTTLAPDSTLFLTPFADASRRDYLGFDSDTPTVLKMIADDLGKYSSDRNDEYTVSGDGFHVKDNSKYSENYWFGVEHESQCSEFISWYYGNYSNTHPFDSIHPRPGKGLHCGGITPSSLLNVHITDQMLDMFESASALYKWVWNEGTQTGGFYFVENWDEDGGDDLNMSRSYSPREADYVAWMEDDGEHSMILRKDWAPTTQRKLKIFDGPWPVMNKTKTLPTTDDDRRYYIGKVRRKSRVNSFNITGETVARAAEIVFSDVDDITITSEGSFIARAEKVTLYAGFTAESGSRFEAHAETAIIGSYSHSTDQLMEIDWTGW